MDQVSGMKYAIFFCFVYVWLYAFKSQIESGKKTNTNLKDNKLCEIISPYNGPGENRFSHVSPCFLFALSHTGKGAKDAIASSSKKCIAKLCFTTFPKADCSIFTLLVGLSSVVVTFCYQ